MTLPTQQWKWKKTFIVQGGQEKAKSKKNKCTKLMAKLAKIFFQGLSHSNVSHFVFKINLEMHSTLFFGKETKTFTGFCLSLKLLLFHLNIQTPKKWRESVLVLKRYKTLTHGKSKNNENRALAYWLRLFWRFFEGCFQAKNLPT